MAAVSPPACERMLAAADGTPLFVRDWAPAADATAVGTILLMHGLGEHCGRHAQVARFFNQRGYMVRAYDHRGHGRSGGARGDVPDSDAILHDAGRVLEDLMQPGSAAAAIGRPPMLFGHSMGGLFAARLAAARNAPLAGLILSSPVLTLRLSAGQQALFKLMSALAPGLGLPNGLQTRYLSHDPAVETAYRQDPLVHRKISTRLLRSMLEAIDFVHAHAAALAIPTLLLVAGADRLVDPGDSRAFFPKLAPGIGTLHIYDRLYHEIFNEPDAERVFADLDRWLTAQQRAAPAAARAAPAGIGPLPVGAAAAI